MLLFIIFNRSITLDLLSILEVENVGGLVDSDDPVGRVDEEAPCSSGELDALDGCCARRLLTHPKL